MSKRTVFIEIGGHNYPMRMGLSADAAIREKYGSMRAMLEKLDGEEALNAATDVVWLLELFIRQGCSYMNKFCADQPPRENARLEDGKYIPISGEDIGDILEFSELNMALKKLFAVILGAQERTVETETKEKN